MSASTSKRIFAVAVALLALVAAGCAHPRLSKPEVTAIAIRAAKVDAAAYEKPVARYWLVPKRHTWEVFFNRILPVPGGEFSVEVNDRTREATVHRGL